MATSGDFSMATDSNLTHYRIRSLLHCGNLAHQIDAL